VKGGRGREKAVNPDLLGGRKGKRSVALCGVSIIFFIVGGGGGEGRAAFTANGGCRREGKKKSWMEKVRCSWR